MKETSDNFKMLFLISNTVYNGKVFKICIYRCAFVFIFIPALFQNKRKILRQLFKASPRFSPPQPCPKGKNITLPEFWNVQE